MIGTIIPASLFPPAGNNIERLFIKLEIECLIKESFGFLGRQLNVVFCGKLDQRLSIWVMLSLLKKLLGDLFAFELHVLPPIE